jgi:3-(3-hydroxy-phenyl)propionate hydroxylase
MCSGVRDAGNLAWKLASVLRAEASDHLLDTYQAEREPHVRAIIETAIAMGKVICLTDAEAARARDAGMRAQRAAGASDISIKYPDLAGGCLDTTDRAGALFLQVFVDGRPSDALLGPSHCLIGRDLGVETDAYPFLRCVDLNDHAARAFAPALEAWLQAHGAQAVLVRPDRHVFGTGDPADLVERLLALGSYGKADPLTVSALAP